MLKTSIRFHYRAFLTKNLDLSILSSSFSKAKKKTRLLNKYHHSHLLESKGRAIGNPPPQKATPNWFLNALCIFEHAAGGKPEFSGKIWMELCAVTGR